MIAKEQNENAEIRKCNTHDNQVKDHRHNMANFINFKWQLYSIKRARSEVLF